MPNSDTGLRRLLPYTPVSPLQLRVAKQIFGLTASDVEAVMKSHGVVASMATFWRAEQSSRRHADLQAQMRAVYERLGLVFYENHAVGFMEENAPSEEEIERIKLPEAVVSAICKLRAEGMEPQLRSMLIRKIDGERITRPGRRKVGRLHVSSGQNTTEKAKK